MAPLLVAAVVVRVEPVADAPVALVGSAQVRVHDAFVVVAAVVEQLHVVVAVAVVELVLRRVRPAAVAVAPVLLHVQLSAQLLHDRRDAARSAGVVDPLQLVARRVELAAEVVAQLVVTFAPLAVHPAVHYAPAARLLL